MSWPARGAAELEGASATDLLRWTDENFGGVNGPRGWATCNYVVASNMQDAVLVDLAAKVRPGVPVLFLDTGYHFVETIGTRDAVESVYDIRVLNVTPEHTVAEQDKLLGKDLFARDPGECCRLRKVAPLGKALRGYSAWVTGLRRVEAPTRANAPLISFDEAFKLVKINPLADLDRRGHAELHRRATTCWSIRLSTKAIRRSAALRARPSPSRAPTRAAGAGRGWPRPNAGCTRRDAPCGADRARKRGSTVGRQRAGRRGPADASCGPASTCGWRSWNSIRRAWSTCSSTAGSRQRWSPRCCWPTPTTPASTSPADRALPVRTAMRQADVLGEDDRLVSVLRERLAELRCPRSTTHSGVLVVAIGSSNAAANARTAQVAPKLPSGTRWAGATTAFATRPERSLAEAAGQLRRHGARRVVIAPWFLAPGRLTDRVRDLRAGQRHSDGGSRWAHTGWWPRPCWTASTRRWPTTPQPSGPIRTVRRDC